MGAHTVRGCMYVRHSLIEVCVVTLAMCRCAMMCLEFDCPRVYFCSHFNALFRFGGALRMRALRARYKIVREAA